MINVIVVDDHPIVRAGMRAVLAGAPDMVVIAEGTTGREALQLVASCQPDVLVLDVNLPDINGLQVVSQLRQQGNETAILILTIHKDPSTIFGLLECGATGYVLKDEALETLAPAIRAAAHGESWLSPAVASQVVSRAVNSAPADSCSGLRGHEPLTPSEERVLDLLAKGLDNASIAAQLVVTKRTVQNHVSSIYSKLGVSTRTEALLYALSKPGKS